MGLRWRTQREVVAGRGQFSCGATVSAGGRCRAAQRLLPLARRLCMSAPWPSADPADRVPLPMSLPFLEFSRNGTQVRFLFPDNTGTQIWLSVGPSS